MISNLYRKINFLIHCFYRGHRFGVTRYLANSEIQECARCGYKRKRKYKPSQTDDFFIC